MTELTIDWIWFYNTCSLGTQLGRNFFYHSLAQSTFDDNDAMKLVGSILRSVG